MLLGLCGCGGSAEPAETTAATTEPAAQVTEAPTEEPTEEPSEAPRVAPVDFEPVDPATLPEPIPVEEQLQSEDTQTVTLGSLEEYEDLLWSLGFGEVRLEGTHKASMMDTSGSDKGYTMLVPVDAYCEPVSLTYNNEAFRFDFTYCMTTPTGETVQEGGWSMYGTKSDCLENISAMTGEEYYKKEAVVGGAISSGDVFSITIDGTQFGSSEEAVDSILSAMQGGTIQGVAGTPTQKEEVKNPNYEEDCMNFGTTTDSMKDFYVKAIYYPVTGNLYNYMCDPNSEGTTRTNIAVTPDGTFQGTVEETDIGYAAQTMCFHYLFPAEDTAE